MASHGATPKRNGRGCVVVGARHRKAAGRVLSRPGVLFRVHVSRRWRLPRGASGSMSARSATAGWDHLWPFTPGHKRLRKTVSHKEVLEPLDLRAEMAELASQLAERYGVHST
jgi:hypothetical protein